MIVRSEQEALSVAVEMERRAIRIYERALMVAESVQVAKGIRSLMSDECCHLRRFAQMREQYGPQNQQEKLLLQSVAAEVLYPGGVMELERAQSLTTLPALYAYAAQSEEEAVEKYTEFATRCTNEAVRSAFLAIAQEESEHLRVLREKLAMVQQGPDTGNTEEQT